MHSQSQSKTDKRLRKPQPTIQMSKQSESESSFESTKTQVTPHIQVEQSKSPSSDQNAGAQDCQPSIQRLRLFYEKRQNIFRLEHIRLSKKFAQDSEPLSDPSKPNANFSEQKQQIADSQLLKEKKRLAKLNQYFQNRTREKLSSLTLHAGPKKPFSSQLPPYHQSSPCYQDRVSQLPRIPKKTLSEPIHSQPSQAKPTVFKTYKLPVYPPLLNEDAHCGAEVHKYNKKLLYLHSLSYLFQKDPQAQGDSALNYVRSFLGLEAMHYIYDRSQKTAELEQALRRWNQLFREFNYHENRRFQTKKTYEVGNNLNLHSRIETFTMKTETAKKKDLRSWEELKLAFKQRNIHHENRESSNKKEKKLNLFL